MRVLVFGGGSDTGGYILKQLKADNHEAVTLAEKENEAEELKNIGAADVLVTTGDDFIKAYAGCEAVIFLSGSNPVSGETKNVLVDHEAFNQSIEAVNKQGIGRFVYLSAVRSDETADSSMTGDKQKPDQLLEQQEFDYTIVRPTRTVNKPGKGTVEAADSLKKKDGEIPYEDLADFLVKSLTNPNTFQKIIEVTGGDTPIQQALDRL